MSVNKKESAHAIILAAGEARRAGGPKIIWPIEGTASVRRVATAALNTKNIESVTAVSGAWRRHLHEALTGLKVNIIHNENFHSGQASSVALAAGSIADKNGSVIFLTADQPFVTSQMLFDLIEFHFRCGAVLSAPFFEGRRRNPMVFSLNRWGGELMTLTGDEGGRAIARSNEKEIALWPADHLNPNVFCDFDTLDDYERLQL